MFAIFIFNNRDIIDAVDDNDINNLQDFNHQGTRELVADDYILQIKRLASPHTNSPVHSLLKEYIVGFENFSRQITQNSYKTDKLQAILQTPLSGVTFDFTIV